MTSTSSQIPEPPPRICLQRVDLYPLQRCRTNRTILACLFQHSDPATCTFVRKFFQFAVFLNRQTAVPITLSDSNPDGAGWALTYQITAHSVRRTVSPLSAASSRSGIQRALCFRSVIFFAVIRYSMVTPAGLETLTWKQSLPPRISAGTAANTEPSSAIACTVQPLASGSTLSAISARPRAGRG